MVGGNNDQYSILGIKFTKIKQTNNTNKKYLSFSLFDSYLNKTTNIRKNINHYTICLYECIKLYLQYLPDYNIRIYGDKSIDIVNNNNINLIKLFELINNNDSIEYFELEQSFNNIPLLDNDNIKHIGLLGALFRFYILLDPKVTHCILVDSDNFPTEIFCNHIKKWETESNNNMLLFKPHYYSRKNINNDCINQLLAGMCGFKKTYNTIINIKIFVKIFEYMDKNYVYLKNGITDNCDNNVKIKYNNPFQFGFEEQSLTNILIPYFISNNQKIIIIPMYFDFGHGFHLYYDKILDNLSFEYQKIIKEKLDIDISNTKSLCFVDPINGFNIHLAIILCNFIDKCLYYNKININGINIFKNDKIEFENFKSSMSIKGFYHMYPTFNILMPIDKVNDYINELFNGTNNLQNLKQIKLPTNAKNEFNKNSLDYYKSYIDENISLNSKKYDNIILNTLLESTLYK